MKYALIGRSLSHSFSKSYFEAKFKNLEKHDDEYYNLEFDKFSTLKESFPILVQEFNGFNVTIPYKEDIIHLLDHLQSDAREIGAVNCIKIVKGESIGYNTDYIGFWNMVEPYMAKRKSALILGTGGASRAVRYAFHHLGSMSTQFVTSKESEVYLNYEEVNDFLKDFDIIVNTTPLGMYPDVESFPKLNYQKINPNTLCIDLIYNPVETIFLKKCRERGCDTINGQVMLEKQADISYQIWTQ